MFDKGMTSEEATADLNIHAPTISTSDFVKQSTRDAKALIDLNTVTVDD